MGQILYKSTRNDTERVTASQAILQGLASDGGLFVPECIPQTDKSLAELAKLDYKGLAYEIISKFLSDYTEEELKDCISKAYDEKFDTIQIAPLREADGAYYLELFHGATVAFKDMALSLLPHLLTTAARKNHVTDEIVILTATSGDTGKAALAGFADVPGTRIIVFYPKDGVSVIQERQMLTQQGANTHVVGVRGNFDDTQTGVKMIFNNKELAKKLQAQGYRFSSANSINIGRLVPQVVYYFWAYCRLLADGCVKDGELIDVVVPTGNFGNILAAYYAKEMGLPLHKLICASNDNKVLYDFFTTGTYDRNREFVLTSSPSMDILISSNLERLIYKIAGENASKNSVLMKQLNQTGRYDISASMQEGLNDFVGGFATEAECAKTMALLFQKTGYCIDTHTAVAACVYNKYKAECESEKNSGCCPSADSDNRPSAGADCCKIYPTVIASTASPYKFTRSVMKAIAPEVRETDDFILADRMSSLIGVAVPAAIESVRSAEIRHNTVCDIGEMQQTVENFLNLA